MSKELDEDKFEDYIEELRREYSENPRKTSKEVKNTVKRIKGETSQKNEFDISDINRNALYTCAIVILIILTFLFHLRDASGEDVGLYFGGLAFFLAGIFIGLYVKGFGLIFLASHGITGLVMLESTYIGNIINSPQMSDSGTLMYMLVVLNILVFVIATILVILHNLSDNLKKSGSFKLIPLSVYLVGLVISGSLYMMSDYIFTIRI